MFSKEHERLKNMILIYNIRQNILHSQFKDLCWCKWSSTLPPYGEVARTGSLCLGMASRGQKGSWESSTLRVMPGEQEEDGQQSLLQGRQRTPRHSHWLTHIDLRVWQQPRLSGSDTEKKAEEQWLFWCHQQPAALGNCLCKLCLKLALIMLALIKFRLRGLGCFGHCYPVFFFQLWQIVRQGNK